MTKAQIYTELDDPQDIDNFETVNFIATGISTIGLGTITSPDNSQLSFELTSNTSLTIRVRGTDGVVRVGIVTLS
jgi:hypothetical protein